MSTSVPSKTDNPAMRPPNEAFNRLVHRKTRLEDAIEAEDHETNPWNGRARSPNYFSLRAQARELAVTAKRREFLELYQNHQVLILTGDTAIGKSTQIPQYILYSDVPRTSQWGGKIVCTQPRRVAARELATRVAVELDVDLGSVVGYSFRREEQHNHIATKLLYTTDGRLLRKMASNPTLDDIRCIIIDEAHERTESTDLLLGNIKALLPKRPNLKLVIMSATIQEQVFQKYLEGPPILKVPGRSFPVRVLYSAGDEQGKKTEVEGLKASVDYVVTAVQTVLHIVQDPEERGLDGDVLIFVPGEENINAIVAGLKFELRPDVLSVRALHGKMTMNQQQQAMAPSGVRRCIVATNVAETSLTIDGIRHVIDTGLQKGMSYNPRLRLWRLQVEPISHASAKQRTGRAGRTAPGICWRLYSKSAYDNLLIKDPLPGVLRSNMAGSVLDTIAIGQSRGADRVWTFDYIDRPSPEVMFRTWHDLQTIGCVDVVGQLTYYGNLAQRFALEPRHAMAILRALDMDPSPAYEVAAMMALLHEDDVFIRPTQLAEFADIVRDTFSSAHGDHFTLLNVWFAFAYQKDVMLKGLDKKDSRYRLERWCEERYLNFKSLQSASKSLEDIRTSLYEDKVVFVPSPSHVLWTGAWVTAVKKALLWAHFTQIAVKDPGDEHTYRTLEENQTTLVGPASAVARGHKYDFVIYDKFVDPVKPYLETVTGVDSQWLFEPNTVVGNFMKSLISEPPEGQRSDKWVSMARLRLAHQKFQRMARKES